MERTDLRRLSKDELIDLVLQLRRPKKTSQASSLPPSLDRKGRRENSKPGGGKPGHKGHFRALCRTRCAIMFLCNASNAARRLAAVRKGG
jgi:transposase